MNAIFDDKYNIPDNGHVFKMLTIFKPKTFIENSNLNNKNDQIKIVHDFHLFVFDRS